MTDILTRSTADEISPSQIDFISEFIHKKTGIVLGQSKKYLITSRLFSVARIVGKKSALAVIEDLQKRPTEQLATLVIDALTTNETLWFRDKKPFDALTAKILPFLHDQKNTKELNIWSAACSSGQEAYSIAMCLHDCELFSGWKMNIWATDISTQVLECAQKAVYSQMEISRGLPVKNLLKYFTEQDDDKWALNNTIKNTVNFEYFNLQTGELPPVQFDLVFCRNVLIYFDRDSKKMILDNILRTMQPHGLLLVGGSESTLGIHDKFCPMRMDSAIYYGTEESCNFWKEITG